MIKIYLYSTDPYEAKCKYLIKKHEKVSLKHYDDPKAFFLDTQMICKMFIKILKNTIQKKT